jgi:hypothetical protein
MYVAVRRYEGVTDPQKAGQLIQEGFIPLIHELPGFVAYYWVDAEDGVMISTSVFEHKDAEEESTFLAGAFVAEHLASLLPNRPQISDHERQEHGVDHAQGRVDEPCHVVVLLARDGGHQTMHQLETGEREEAYPSDHQDTID